MRWKFRRKSKEEKGKLIKVLNQKNKLYEY